MSEPVKQVIVMRKDLNMRKGKMIAQGAHASIAFLTNWMNQNGHAEVNDSGDVIYNFPMPKVWEEWVTGKFTKICVSVNSEDELLAIYYKATVANLTVRLIQDAGLTEFDGVPTHTCLAIGPDYSDRIDEITGELPLL